MVARVGASEVGRVLAALIVPGGGPAWAGAPDADIDKENTVACFVHPHPHDAPAAFAAATAIFFADHPGSPYRQWLTARAAAAAAIFFADDPGTPYSQWLAARTAAAALPHHH